MCNKGVHLLVKRVLMFSYSFSSWDNISHTPGRAIKQHLTMLVYVSHATVLTQLQTSNDSWITAAIHAHYAFCLHQIFEILTLKVGWLSHTTLPRVPICETTDTHTNGILPLKWLLTVVNTKVKVRHRYIKTSLPFTDDMDNNSKLYMKETNYRRQPDAIKLYWESSV